MTDMSGMSGMDPSSTSSASMAMSTMPGMSIFQTSASTPLYSLAWTPATPGAYAGTCIFLIVLAAALRALLAARSLAERRWLDAELRRRYVVVQGKAPLAERLGKDALARHVTLSENGVEEDVVVVDAAGGHGVGPGSRPWRLSVDPLRAAVDTAVAGIGYLLMLAVMTANVGYFLSVLAGVFLGSLLVGRYTFLNFH